MKRILITGKNGYIGNSFEQWVSQWPGEYIVDKVSLRDNDWENADWSVYDTVFHAAGIAHRKITKENEHEYCEVNRDLAIEVAKKAKIENVSQFIFLSTMSVYGLSTGAITDDTPLEPKNVYGKTKLEAEDAIQAIGTSKFSIAIVRPPMVYGKGCKGNYVTLSNFAQKSPVFPNIHNQRSMIYIDNLSEFVKLLIDYHLNGIFMPQNNRLVKTSEMVKIIAKANDKRIKLIKLFNPILNRLNINMINKVFGDLYYASELSYLYDSLGNQLNYNSVDFIESVVRTEYERT